MLRMGCTNPFNSTTAAPESTREVCPGALCQPRAGVAQLGLGEQLRKGCNPVVGGLQHHALPLGATSVPFRAPWITAWASEFFFFRKSMVSRRSSSSVSWGSRAGSRRVRSDGAEPTLTAPLGQAVLRQVHPSPTSPSPTSTILHCQ